MKTTLCLLAIICACFVATEAQNQLCPTKRPPRHQICFDLAGKQIDEAFYCIMRYECCYDYSQSKGRCYKPIGDTENSVGSAGRLQQGNPQNRPSITLTTSRVQFSGSCLFHCTSVERYRRISCYAEGSVDMYSCMNAGCCYDASDSVRERRCFFPLPANPSCPRDRCLATNGSLTRCNAFTPQTCLASGCCWQQVAGQDTCYAEQDPPTVLMSSNQFAPGPVITDTTTSVPTTTATPVPTTTKQPKFLDVLVQNGGRLEDYSVVELLSKSITQLLRKRNRTATTTTPKPTTTTTTTTTVATTTRQARVLTTQPAFVMKTVCRWGSCRQYRVKNTEIDMCYPTDCGRPRFFPGSQNTVPSSFKKIVGGSKAYPFSHPWTVMIVKSEGKKSFLCGASIICKRWLVTTAHCFNKQSRQSSVPDLDAIFYTIYVGRYMGKDYSPGKQIQVFHGRKDIDFIELHEDFKSGVSRGVVGYDIAVIKLKRDIEYNDFAQPICLPTKSAKVDQIVWATGWGETKNRGASNQNMKQLGVKILNETVCNSQVPKFEDNPPPGVLCAGGELEHDTCTGDSGGPLAGPIPVIERRRRVIRWQLFGMTSFGSPTCNTFAFDRQPAVYTDIAHYKDWIHKRTNYCCD